MLLPNEIVIHDGNAHEVLRDDLVINGERKSRGLVPRNLETHPVGCYRNIPPMRSLNMPVFSDDDITKRLAQQLKDKARLSDVRMTANDGQPFPSLNQDGVGYCWAHSTTHGVMYMRAVMNLPYIPLSAFAVAATIKNGRDEGGWGAQSADFAVQRGIPSQALWPQLSRDLSHGTTACWADAAKHKITGMFADLGAEEYDRKMQFNQEVTCTLTGSPVISDFNWWSHSVLTVDFVDGQSMFDTFRAATGKLFMGHGLREFDKIWGMNHPVTGGRGRRIQNSWGDEWSSQGMGVLTGDKAVSDGGVAIWAATAA